MHTIRLRRPWLRAAGQGSAAETVDVPDATPVASPAGEVIYERNFNCPTGLEAADRVWLAVDQLRGSAVVIVLNGTVLADAAIDSLDFPWRADVTEQLASSNKVAIRLKPEANSIASIDGEVSLRIEAVN